MKVLLLVTFLTALIPQIFGQQSKIDKQDLKSFVKILTSDSLEGRGTGTIGQKRADKFISDRFRNLGLNTFNNNSYLEKFNLTQTFWGKCISEHRTSYLIILRT